MKFFDEVHLQRVATTPHPLFGNEMPPADGGTGSKMLAFVEGLQSSLSLRETMKRVGCSLGAYEDFCNRSLWFCRSINAIAAHAQDEAAWVQLSQALGAVKADDNGNALLDAEGKPVRSGVSDAAAKLVVQHRMGTMTLPALPPLADVPPLLPSNVAEQRQLQINNLHRSLLALQPACDAGDRQAIDTQIKLQDQLSKLQGTHAPKVAISYAGDGRLARLSDAELEAIARGGLTLVASQQDDGSSVYECPPDPAD
jgi:hypothetical protein